MYYKKELNAIEKSNRFRTRKIYDDDLIDLASNDYLGLASKKELFNKACELVSKEKFSSSKASMIVNGYSKIHKQFEDKLCEVNGFEEGIVVGSGFLANISMIESMVRKKDILFIDEEYHASGILATKLSQGEIVLFKHNDFNDLEDKISKSTNKRIIIAIEGVYSMMGDIAPKEFNDIALKYNTILIVDEAHSSGVIGENLLGWYDYHNIEIKPNHIKMGTLGKAYGSYGAYILASNHLISYLINRAKPIIYSTAPSLFDTALGLVSLEYIIDNKDNIKQQIKEYQGIVKNKLDIKIDSLILPIIINNNQEVLAQQKFLIEKNFIIGAIRQPTVKQAILRIIIKLDISKKDMIELFKYLLKMKYH